jgi:pre-mRNA-processing factor 40
LPPNPILGINGTESALGRPLGTPLGGMPPPPSPATGALPPRPNMPDDPIIPHNGFATHEEAEKAFNHLLRKAGVDPTWTWDQTMRAVITDPLYKALNSLAEKKACWQKVFSLHTFESSCLISHSVVC